MIGGIMAMSVFEAALDSEWLGVMGMVPVAGLVRGSGMELGSEDDMEVGLVGTGMEPAQVGSDVDMELGQVWIAVLEMAGVDMEVACCSAWVGDVWDDPDADIHKGVSSCESLDLASDGISVKCLAFPLKYVQSHASTKVVFHLVFSWILNIHSKENIFLCNSQTQQSVCLRYPSKSK